MARSKNDVSNALINVIKFIIDFFINAYKAGRIVELLISVPLLIGTYYLLYLCAPDFSLWLLVPALVFLGYWKYLFSHEKVSMEADPNWADRNWWWKLDGWEFEEEAARVFRLNGYKAEVTKKTGDGGIDILMYKNGKKIIVQSKHYTKPVGVSVARELNGIKDDFGADELFLIASSGITESCREFIMNKPYFKIFDLEDIIRMGLRPSP
jgi:hypothetical protein